MNSILTSRYSGWFKAEIQAVNPDKDELEALLEEEVQDIPEYYYDKKDGTKCARLDFYIKDIKSEILFKYSIFLEDKPESFKSGTRKYINQLGAIQITNDESNLFKNFSNFTDQKWENGRLISEDILGDKQYRIAKNGEQELTHLHIISQETFNKNGNYLLDIDKILDGDLSELKIRFNEPVFSAYAYVMNNENYDQRLYKQFMKLLDFQSLALGSSNKYNTGSIKKWEAEWDKYKEGKIYKFGKLDNITEEDLPKNKELTEDESDY